jgi:hypothetical protein
MWLEKRGLHFADKRFAQPVAFPPTPHSTTPPLPAISLDCQGRAFAITGNELAGARSLLRLSLTTGAATLVCRFPSLELVQVRHAPRPRDAWGRAVRPLRAAP